MLDTDELIVPSVGKTWLDMLDEGEENNKHRMKFIGGVTFQHVYLFDHEVNQTDADVAGIPQ